MLFIEKYVVNFYCKIKLHTFKTNFTFKKVFKDVLL